MEQYLDLLYIIAISYRRTLIGKDINTNKGRDVMSVLFWTMMGIMGIVLTAL